MRRIWVFTRRTKIFLGSVELFLRLRRIFRVNKIISSCERTFATPSWLCSDWPHSWAPTRNTACRLRHRCRPSSRRHCLPFLHRSERCHRQVVCHLWQRRESFDFVNPFRHLQQCLQQLLECFWHKSCALAVFPELADDSYATIGLDGPAAFAAPGSEDPSLVQDASLPTTVSGYFQAGGTELNVNTLTGASWYVLNTAANALPSDGRWLIAQITTAGDISLAPSTPKSSSGEGADQIQQTWNFVGDEVEVPCEGELDECGVCDGPGIPEGACDCDGNVLDDCGVCVTEITSHALMNGVLNGPGAIYECGCTDIPEDAW